MSMNAGRVNADYIVFFLTLFFFFIILRLTTNPLTASDTDSGHLAVDVLMKIN